MASPPVERASFLADQFRGGPVRWLNRRAESLHDLSAIGKNRLRTYAAMAERILAQVRRGRRVCFVLYGHPGVFAMPAHAAVQLARDEGFEAAMLPGISADAWLIPELRIDPPSDWPPSYGSTGFLLRQRRIGSSVG